MTVRPFPGMRTGFRGIAVPMLILLSSASCGSGTGPADPGPGVDVPAGDLAATDDAPDREATDAHDPGTADLRDDPGGDPGDGPVPPDAGDAGADPAGDADAGPDVPHGPWWEGLAGSGEPVGGIVAVASHMDTDDSPDPLRDFEFDQYLPFDGFKIRRGLRWSNVEPAQDDWRWNKVDTAVSMSAEHGVRILPLLAYGNDWAQDDPDVYGTVRIPEYADYAGHMAERFCATVKDYEIWNEQNITRFWHVAPDPAKYADLLSAAATAIRAACPDARVVFGGMSSYDDVDLFDTWGFLRRALEARPSACDAFDALALHPYTWFQFDPPEHDEEVSFDITKRSQTGMTTLARDILAGAGCDPKPILFTEVGWPSYELTEEQVGRFAARSLLLAARDGVEGWYWYTFWDDAPDASGIRPHENYFGLWAWPGEDESVRRPKPAWIAVKAAGTLLKPYRFARDLGAWLGLPNDVYALAFVDSSGAIALALWDGREMPDVTLDGDDEGGPDTAIDLALPVPDGVAATRRFDQDGTELEAPAAGDDGTLPLHLTTRVQYLFLDTEAPGTPPAH